MDKKETDRIIDVYERREKYVPPEKYALTNASVLRSVHERQRALVSFLDSAGVLPLSAKRIIEIGCGSGGNLIDFIRLGASPENLVGNDLIEVRLNQAAALLPGSVQLILGDAAKLDVEHGCFDIAAQFTVFSSILDLKLQESLANQMWNMVAPGGGVLWYDFTYNNPSNKEVRGVPMRRIKRLFPHAKIRSRRLTLAPPLARAIPPSFYEVFNWPFLRTHLMCWIAKPLS
jgi:SAM-dependent methyltransferase